MLSSSLHSPKTVAKISKPRARKPTCYPASSHPLLRPIPRTPERLARILLNRPAALSDVSTASPARTSGAHSVVREFYDGINRRDLTSVEPLIGEDCIYEDLIFTKPFVGRKAVLDFFKKFTESISSDLQFVIDDISNEDTLAVGVTWHLEWQGKPFPFSKGCSFYRLEEVDGKRQIVYGRDCVEPATKPGELALRSQKLLEEAPSPALTPELCKTMGDVAVAAAVGTVEFLLDERGEESSSFLNTFYFMEMNTRIQVVTEMISSTDLIEEQIRVALGERLTYKQEDIVLRGHSIVCRINAEDLFKGGVWYTKSYIPMRIHISENIDVGNEIFGRITAYLPSGGPFVRMDSHIYTDCCPSKL